MKTTVLFLFLICASTISSNAQVERLTTEIQSSNKIECYYLGKGGSHSQLFMKADTLSKVLSLEEEIQLFSDSNKVLKYYCFYNTLTENDSVAFALLKQFINDSNEVAYHCGCMIDTYSFNSLLVEKYNMFIQAKYRDDSPTVMGDGPKVHMFPKANKKKYKEKYNELVLLINQSVYKEQLLQVIQ